MPDFLQLPHLFAAAGAAVETTQKGLDWITPTTFLLFTGLVGLITWIITHKDNLKTNEGYFLAGRSLTFPFIAGSLLLTNLSTEQMVGLNGDAFTYGLSVMAWEVVAVVALVAMALFFLPRFLKSGIATVPQFLELRFDRATGSIANLIFLAAYMVILLPIVLYTGAQGLISILDLRTMPGMSDLPLLYVIVIAIGVIGSIYALFAAILDYREPWKVIARSKRPLLFPETPYERTGRAGNVVFTCNALLEPDNSVKIYYGAADTCIGLAEMQLEDIVKSCYEGYQYMLNQQ